MSGPDTDQSKRPTAFAGESRGVLSNLPRTRPQRSSPRRAAARKADAPKQTAKPSATGTSKRRSPGASKRPRSKRPLKSSPEREPVPRQGFECETERTSGSVQPPGGAELVASAAEIIGELARASVSTGERLLKDVFSRLPLS